MVAKRVDLRDVPRGERHVKVFDAFQRAGSDSLTIVTDREPTPLFHRLRLEVDEFDVEPRSVDVVGPCEFFVTTASGTPARDRRAGDTARDGTRSVRPDHSD